MKRLFLLLLAIPLLAISAHAQTCIKYNDIAKQGGKIITSGVTSTTSAAVVFPGATVSVYATGTTNTVSLFSDSACSVTKSNPFTASSPDASYSFYIVAPRRVDIRISPSGGSPSPFTTSDITINGGATLDLTNYGVTCNGTTDDYINAQAALDAAKTLSHATLLVPQGCKLKTSAKLQLNAAVSVTFGTNQPEGYSYNNASAQIIWAGSAGGTEMEVLGSSGCRIQGLLFVQGTANIGLNIDTGPSGTSTSNTVIGVQFSKAASDVNTIGLGISRNSSVNNERMRIESTACFFGGSTDVSNLNRGKCFEIGQMNTGNGINAKNTLFINDYWFGASYGLALNAGDATVINSESNFASVDFTGNVGSLVLIAPYSESGRQFFKGRGTVQIIGGTIGNGGWDNSFPIIQMSFPDYPTHTGGSGVLHLSGVTYVVQAGVNAVDADNTGTYYINSDALNAGNNTWPDGTPNVSNFTYNRTYLDIPTLRGTQFALLAVFTPPSGYGTQLYCTDCREGSDPCTGSSTGALASYVHGRWKCDGLGNATNLPTNVSIMATGGIGTSGSPWTGWDTAITWAANKAYYFPAGYYSYSTAPNWALQNIALIGDGPNKSILKFTGTGNAVVFDTGATGGGNGTNGVRFENLSVQGNASATNGIFLRFVNHSTFRNLEIRNVSSAGFRTNFAVSNTYDTIRVSVNEGAFTTTPTNGFVFDKRGANEKTTASVVINPIIEGVSGDGIDLISAQNMTFLGGTSEGNGGRGMNVRADASMTNVLGMDFESNASDDITDNGTLTMLRNIFSGGTIRIGATSAHSTVEGGLLNTYLANTGTDIYTTVRGYPYYNINGTGILGTGGALNAESPFINSATGAIAGPGYSNNVTFANSWVDFGGASPFLFRRVQGQVIFRGAVKSGTSGATSFTMPTTFRPGTTVTFTIVCGAGNDGKITINSSGVATISVGSGSNDACYLDTVHYDAQG